MHKTVQVNPCRIFVLLKYCLSCLSLLHDHVIVVLNPKILLNLRREGSTFVCRTTCIGEFLTPRTCVHRVWENVSLLVHLLTVLGEYLTLSTFVHRVGRFNAPCILKTSVPAITRLGTISYDCLVLNC